MKNNTLNRRDFMKFLLGSSALGAIGQLGSLSDASAAAPSFNDYKALVCVFFKGGNDSFNMLVPNGADASKGYNAYSTIRGNLAIANTALGIPDLNAMNLGTGNSNLYHVDGSEESAYLRGLYSLSGQSMDLGVNGVMPELAKLIADSKASVISNVGTLVRPVNRTEIQSETAELPVFLFAHNHQQRILQTGQANNLNDIGWAGKIADQWSGINNNSPLGLNISYSGNDRMLIGNQSSPLVLGTGTPPRFSEMVAGKGNANNDRIALFKALMGVENISSSGNLNFDASNTFTTNDQFKRIYGDMLNKSFSTFDQLYEVWNANPISYSATGSYGEALFGVPKKADLGFSSEISGKLISQLDAVAKMIHLAATGKFNNKAFNRQVFFVSLGGFDTHAAQVAKHPLLLREISLALWKFQKAMEELGHANKVTTFTMSDFGRTMSNNGDGTDHAWGAHHIVMGGDGLGSSGNLKGGQMIGSLPDVTLEGTDDHDKKGRIIPAIGQDQLNATLCRWFGVDESTLASIFPNLSNFETSNGVVSSAYLNNLFAA